MIYKLSRKQFIPASLTDVWTYFSRPNNLNEMTPPEMDFEILRGGDQDLYAGQIISYKVTIFPKIRVHWLTQITHVESGIRFIDEQRSGPYGLWIHEHQFEDINNGVMMTDIVNYALSYGIFGDIAQKLLIRRKLDQIFDFRFKKVNSLFNNFEKT